MSKLFSIASFSALPSQHVDHYKALVVVAQTGTLGQLTLNKSWVNGLQLSKCEKEYKSV